ncbi:unnamed protein product [Linum tenue]|uniref:Uncharacterized protein n=2 Tax=Linum tenue TaxID=586396 RepID=A0AAV0RHM8_9ROSI|nr:unnamed protein product [Linum tenue]
MSTQWTSPSSRLMRWRVRDWVSCFLASRIPPLDDDAANGNFRNMVCECNVNDGGTRQYRRKSRRRKERRILTDGETDHDDNNTDDNVSGGGVSGSKSTGNGEATERELCVVDGTGRRRRRHPDDDNRQEEYIVFRFGENGAFEVVKDGRHRNNYKPQNHTNAAESNLEVVTNTAGGSSSSASKPTVNRKLNYGNQENGRRDESSSAAAGKGRWEEKLPLPTTHQHGIVGSSVKPEILHSQQVEHGEENCSFRRHPLGEIDRNQFGTSAAAESGSSRDNSQSSSSGSFSFPVLQWEEMVGSPVQMPKPEDNFHLRKHRMNCARFQCCRFRRNSID